MTETTKRLRSSKEDLMCRKEDHPAHSSNWKWSRQAEYCSCQQQFFELVGNFVDKGVIGSPDDLIVYDPHEKPNVAFGIDYDHYFWEIFGALEGWQIQAHRKETPMMYLTRLRSQLSVVESDAPGWPVQKSVRRDRFHDLIGAATHDQIRDIVAAFHCYHRLISYMTTCKVGLQQFLLHDMNDTICALSNGTK